MPEPGFGILVPSEARDAGDGDDQAVPVRSKPSGRNGEGLDPAALLPAVRRLADRLDTVGRTFGGADGFKGVVKRWLIGLDLGNQEIAGVPGGFKCFFDSEWRPR